MNRKLLLCCVSYIRQLKIIHITCFIVAAQETEAVKKQYIKILDAYGCLGVLQLNAGDTTVLYLVMITGCFSIGKVGESEIFRITQTYFVPLHYQHNEERISEV